MAVVVVLIDKFNAAVTVEVVKRLLERQPEVSPKLQCEDKRPLHLVCHAVCHILFVVLHILRAKIHIIFEMTCEMGYKLSKSGQENHKRITLPGLPLSISGHRECPEMDTSF